jgi:general secretion pathway protein H
MTQRLNKKGFTLLEILVAVTLLIMVGTLVSVNIGKAAADKKPRAFARQMISLFKKARRVAVDNGKPMAVYISSSKRRCWINGEDTSLEIPEQMLVEGEGVSRLSSDIHVIRFYPDGSSSGGDLTLSISGRPVYAFRVDMLMGLVTRIEEDA